MQRPSIPLEVDPTYLPEIWTYYVLGVIIISLRFAVRIRISGWRGFTGDDYVAVLTLLLYTLNALIVQITYHTGSNLDIPTPLFADHLLPDDIALLTLGSQLEFASWYTYSGFLWSLKFAVLLFYRRLTFGFRRRRTLAALFWSCGLSYLALCLTVSLSCRPYANNWRVRPLPGHECTFRKQNFFVLVVLNVLTDAAIMVIPVPLLWRLRVPLGRKIGVSVLLSSGAFIITMAILRAVLTIQAPPSVLNVNRWGFRESIVGLITVTAPVLCPFFTREFWRRGRYRREGRELHYRQWPGRGRGPDRPDFGNWLKTVELRPALGDESENEEGPSTPQTLETDGGGITQIRTLVITRTPTAQEMYASEIHDLERNIRAGGEESGQ